MSDIDGYGCAILVEVEVWRGTKRGKLFVREGKKYGASVADIARAVADMAADAGADIREWGRDDRSE